MFQMEVCHLVLLQQRQLLLQMLLQFMRGRARLDILFKRSQASIKASMIEASKPVFPSPYAGLHVPQTTLKFDDGSSLQVSRKAFLEIRARIEGMHDMSAALPKWLKTWCASAAIESPMPMTHAKRARVLLPDFPELDDQEEEFFLPPALVDLVV